MPNNRVIYMKHLFNQFFTPRPLAARGIVMLMTGWRAGRDILLAPKLSSYHIKFLEINIMCGCDIVVVQHKVLLVFQSFKTIKIAYFWSNVDNLQQLTLCGNVSCDQMNQLEENYVQIGIIADVSSHIIGPLNHWNHI